MEPEKEVPFTEIPLSKEEEFSKNFPKLPNPEDRDSDQDTLVSDSEDKELVSKQTTRQPRPSFTIGGSDSDSVATSVDSGSEHGNKKRHKLSTELKPIPSFDSGNFNPNNESVVVGVPQGRPGYMGGSSSRSQLHCSVSQTSSQNNCFNSSQGGGEGVSYKEIRLFATDDDGPRNFTGRQWLTFTVFGFVELFSAMVISLQAPFYPLEAEKKGATATEYGLVFGIFELTVFLISPIYGSRINKIGPKLVFNLGIFVTSLSAIGFGFLDKVNDPTLFIGLSMAIRIIEALGEAAFITASFVIIAAEFPQSVSTTFAAMETFYGLGLIIGPLAGGLLYQIGGYTLPFLTVGGLLLVAAVFTTFALPSTKQREVSSSSSPQRNHSNVSISDGGSGFKMFSLLTIPTIALSAFSIFAASASISYLNATMEPFIRNNSLSSSPVATGAIFIVNGGVYAISSPLFGWLCDKVVNHLKIITVFGGVMIFMGFGLIGPLEWIPLEPSLWGVIVGQAVQGIGLGAVLVSAFVLSLREAIKIGLPDNVQTYSLVSGVWTSMWALGAFTGATVSGVLFDIVGFRTGSVSILGLQLVVVVLILLSMCVSSMSSCCIKPDRYENAPLIQSRRNDRPSSSKVRRSPVPGTSTQAQKRHANGNYGSV